LKKYINNRLVQNEYMVDRKLLLLQGKIFLLLYKLHS